MSVSPKGKKPVEEQPTVEAPVPETTETKAAAAKKPRAKKTAETAAEKSSKSAKSTKATKTTKTAKAEVEQPAEPKPKTTSTRKKAAAKASEPEQTASTSLTETAPVEEQTAVPTPAEEPVSVPEAAAEPVVAAAAEPQQTDLPASEEAAPVEPAAEEPAPVEAEAPVEAPAPEEVPAQPAAEEPAPVEAEAPVEAPAPEEAPAQPAEEPAPWVPETPRKSVAMIGSECYPFVKTGGLGDVMYALPRALARQNCDVKVILPRYKCIPWEYQCKMVYRGAFQMDLCADGRTFYVGIMEYVWDGVVYDFIDNEEFFSFGNPYTNLIDDIPKFCYFAKAALAALNYMDWIPDIIHCHDWQAALVPVYLRTLFANTQLNRAKTILTIHNLKFQGIYNIPTIQYWSGLPDYVFNKDALKTGYEDANMMKGGLTYCNAITTVSPTYAWEIQTPYYGETLDAHLRYHAGKIRGIVNGIDVDIWNPATDENLPVNYDIGNVLPRKKENKRYLQEELGLVQDDHKFVIGLISRLTDQKGLDLINAIMGEIMDEHTQVVVLGTGDSRYENAFRYYENIWKGNVCSNIMYDESRAHRIYAGADALLVPSRFEPCGLTQLTAMRYGTIPIVRETGGLKDTVEPYNQWTNTGKGFTFDRYDAGLLLDAINRAKTLYFTNRWCWDEMVQRDMDQDLSWNNSAAQYKNLYLELT